MNKMLLMILFVSSIFAVAKADFKYSTDDLEKFIIEAIQSNDTYDIDFGDQKPCEPFVNERPNYVRTDRRISETKCLEYIWEMENREKEMEWGEMCRIYLISQIKKGIMPEFFFIINSPVIFGGRGAKPEEFPHMGAIGWRAKDESQKWSFKCGSTLISDKFALTAGHCSKLSTRLAPDIVSPVPEIVRFGVENIAASEFLLHGNLEDVKIQKIITHPNYKAPQKYYDIAVIELETPVKFKGNLQPACLWPYSDVSPLGTEAILTGWGNTESGKQSTELQAAVVEVIDTPKCDNILTKFHNRNWHGFEEHQMCAGKLAGGIDTCQGDSGGPLQVKIPLNTEGNMYQVIGITSFGMKCAEKNRPGVYTRVSSFIDWIEEVVWRQNNAA